MPFGYLVSVLIMAVAVVFALAPPRRPGWLAAVGFRFGLLVNEVPVLAVVWLAVWTVFAFVQGDLASGWAWVPVAVAAATVAGLVVITRRQLRAGLVVRDALARGLGSGPGGDRVLARPPYARILLLPLRRRRFGVRHTRNIRYGDAGRRNLLDVYTRRDRPANAPVLIHMHGGGYYRGRKDSQSLPLLYHLAARGWVCVSANYRLRPAVQHPEHLVDLKKVIAWVRAHGAEYGADPATVFVAGSSAGGHMAALAALTVNDPAFQPGFEGADTTVTAAICLNAYLGSYYGQGPQSGPAYHARPDAPPFLIVHGDRDSMAPVEMARGFAAELSGVSAGPVVYVELPGAQHAFDLFHSLRFDAVIGAVEAFAAWVRGRAAGAGDRAVGPDPARHGG